MGNRLNCCSSHAPSNDRKPHGFSKVEDDRLILKLLAEVNTLSSDEGPLRWQPLFHSLVPLSLHSVKQEGEVHTYRLSATGVDGTTFSANVRVPGTKIRKTAACFIQWRDDEKGGAWGLNFMSESDAMKFLNGCSPSSLTPGSQQLRHALSTVSLSLPIPNPPSQDVTTIHQSHSHSEHGLDSIILQSHSENPKPNHKTLDTSTPENAGSYENTEGEGTYPHSPSETSITSELDQLPAPDISYASLLALDQIPPDSDTAGSVPRYSPPLAFHSHQDARYSKMETNSGVNSAYLMMAHKDRGDEEWSDEASNSTVDTESCEDDVIGDSPVEDANLPALFQSPIEIDKDFILPDIIEVSETEESDSDYNGVGELRTEDGSGIGGGQLDGREFDPMKLKFEEAGLEGLEYVETSFSENDKLALKQEGKGPVTPATLPSLPLSPPPGPVLSPRYSMLLTEEEKDVGDSNSQSYTGKCPDSIPSGLISCASPSSPVSHSQDRDNSLSPISHSPIFHSQDRDNSLSPISHSQDRDNSLSPISHPEDRHDSSSPISHSQDRHDSSSHSTDRFSIISLTDDTPPPLPTSLPPGKLISPRHSMILNPTLNVMELGEALWGLGTQQRRGLDVNLLAAQMANLAQEQGTEVELPKTDQEGIAMVTEGDHKHERNEVDFSRDEGSRHQPISEQDSGPIIQGSSTDTREGHLEEDTIETLPPPDDYYYNNEDTPHRGSKLKITPSFLRSLEPPAEFSDSGFPDTDAENPTNTSPSDQSGKGASVKEPRSSTKGSVMTECLEVPVLSHRKSSLASVTSYSDERLTEYSGSVGLKTTASSSSLPSLGSQEDDNRSSSMDTLAAADDTRATDRHPQHIQPTDTKPSLRKTGWLEVKAMLVRKNRKVAMASKRRWKKYWATLKGSALLLYQCDDSASLSENAHVDLKLDLGLSLVHAVHDHVKRDHIFCLSTSSGNTYYMQTTNQAEVEDWITTIHCAATTAITRQSNRGEAIKIMQNKAESLNKMIEKEGQLRNLTELNLTAVSDYAARSMATQQLVACAENIEQYNVELYRLRCYMASLQGTELPNPQSLLGCVSKTTKMSLGRVGIFSVASLHAIVSARQGGSLSTSTGYSAQRTGGKGKALKQKAGALLKTHEKSKRSLVISGPYPIYHSLSSLAIPAPLRTHQDEQDLETTDGEEPSCIDFPAGMPVWPAGFVNVVRVTMPNKQSVQIAIRNDMTVRDVMVNSCEKVQLNPNDHFLRLRWERHDGEFECEVPYENEFFIDLSYSQVEICQKFVHTVILSRSEGNDFGLTLEPVCDSNGSGMSLVVVGRVEEGGVGDTQGVNEGDEVVLINDTSVLELGWEGVGSELQAPTVSLTLRTCHIEMPVSDVSTSRIMESLICPVPPSQAEISREILNRLIVPMPSLEDLTSLPAENHPLLPDVTKDHIDVLLKDSHELSKLLRKWRMEQLSDETTSWTRKDRLKKSAQDLVETEREYIRFLDLLIERYLEPLKYETFICQEEVEVLSGNIVEIAEFQKKFLKSLEDALEMEMDSDQVPQDESPLKHVVFGVAGAFLYYVDHFRLYSIFCASHHRVKDIVSRQDNVQLQQFLEARNPKNNTSLNFVSLMAKPIVRVSRYPLFLNVMFEHTLPDSDERMHLQDAIEGMVRVADYINEMQRISETYSSLFDSMLKQSGLSEFGVSVNVSHLKYHSHVLWLNPTEEQLAKGWKKGQGPSMLCFVFNSAIILLCVDKKFKRRGSKPSQEVTMTAEDMRYKALLPSVQCGVHDLPDSDGVTNMWQLLYKSKPGTPPANYLLRSQSIEQKSTMVHLVRQSIQQQQLLYGNPSGRATPSSVSGRGSPGRMSNQRLHRIVSPSHLSIASGYYTSDTDHD